MSERPSLIDLGHSVAIGLRLSDRRFASVVASLISWGQVDSKLWAEAFGCHFLDLADRLLTDEGMMDDLLSHYYRGNTDRKLRRLQVRYTLLHLLSDLAMAAEINTLL